MGAGVTRFLGCLKISLAETEDFKIAWFWRLKIMQLPTNYWARSDSNQIWLISVIKWENSSSWYLPTNIIKLTYYSFQSLTQCWPNLFWVKWLHKQNKSRKIFFCWQLYSPSTVYEPNNQDYSVTSNVIACIYNHLNYIVVIKVDKNKHFSQWGLLHFWIALCKDILWEISQAVALNSLWLWAEVVHQRFRAFRDLNPWVHHTHNLKSCHIISIYHQIQILV